MTKVKALLMAVLLGAPMVASAQNVEINETNFPDENFRSYVLEYCGADGVLTKDVIENWIGISITLKDIGSLKGIEYFTALQHLRCYLNQLTTLDLSKNTDLTYLQCYRNQLTELNISKNTALTELSCFSNQLTTLDISNNKALERLNCNNNLLTTLDVSNNVALTSLVCENNQLTALDVSKNTALTDLACDGNLLTALDVSSNTELKTLGCYHNQIKGAAMDALIASLPQTDQGTLYVIWDWQSTEGNVCTKAQVAAARAKGWIAYHMTDDWWAEYEGCDEEPMGIIQLTDEVTKENVPAYTLSGQKVSGFSKKGVYIIGGKKVVIK